MTKDEMQLRIEELEKEIKGYEHIASAVKAKDVEIINKNRQINELESLADIKYGDLKKDFIAISKENRALKEQIENIEKRDEGVFKGLKELEKETNRVKSIAQSYISAFRSYMKNVQGGLENAIELEAHLAASIPNKKEV